MKFIISDTSLTIFANGRPYTVTKEHTNWEAIRAAARQDDEAAVLRLIDLPQTVTNWASTKTGSSDITINTTNEVCYQGKPVHTVVTRKILAMIKDGFDPGPMCRFLAKVMKNPSFRAVEELYKFLEHNNLPLAEDGDFYGYKRIRSDWKDVYSGTIDNSIGALVTKPRNEVDDNPNNTCSRGLHVASLGYLAHYSGERLILTKQSPEHVVSVPVDYHNTKMRVCEYAVVEELDMEKIAETDANWKSVRLDTPPDDNEDEDEDEDDPWLNDDDRLADENDEDDEDDEDDNTAPDFTNDESIDRELKAAFPDYFRTQNPDHT